MPNTTKVACAHTEIWPLEKFVPHPRNPNRHPAEQLRLLGKVIVANGWRSPVCVSRRSGFVIKGHGRLEAARLAGLESAPVDLQDYANEAEEWADMVADNRLAELAEISAADLSALLRDLETAGTELETVGFTEKEFADLVGGIDPEKTTPEAARKTLCERFGVPPFSVLDARQGYWQDRKRAWLALGLQSELGRGGTSTTSARAEPGIAPTYRQIGGGRDASPGGSPRPACDYSQRQRGNGAWHAII